MTQEKIERDLPEELGLSLASLFLFDRIIFVEGASDEAVLRQLASKLEINLTEKNVGFIAIGGSRNLHYYAAESILEFLLKRQAKLWFVIDRDERNLEEIKSIEHKLRNLVDIHFWTKREIENYLIEPEAIQQLQEHKARMANKPLTTTIEHIDSEIESCTEKLKQLAILKRVARQVCRPVYPKLDPDFAKKISTSGIEAIRNELNQIATEINSVNSKVDEIHGRVSEEVEKVWNEKCRDIVPGTELLDSVFQKFDLRFKKRRDSERLAQYLPEEKISDEIKEFLENVTS